MGTLYVSYRTFKRRHWPVSRQIPIVPFAAFHFERIRTWDGDRRRRGGPAAAPRPSRLLDARPRANRGRSADTCRRGVFAAPGPGWTRDGCGGCGARRDRTTGGRSRKGLRGGTARDRSVDRHDATEWRRRRRRRRGRRQRSSVRYGRLTDTDGRRGFVVVVVGLCGLRVDPGVIRRSRHLSLAADTWLALRAQIYIYIFFVFALRDRACCGIAPDDRAKTRPSFCATAPLPSPPTVSRVIDDEPLSLSYRYYYVRGADRSRETRRDSRLERPASVWTSRTSLMVFIVDEIITFNKRFQNILSLYTIIYYTRRFIVTGIKYNKMSIKTINDFVTSTW